MNKLVYLFIFFLIFSLIVYLTNPLLFSKLFRIGPEIEQQEQVKERYKEFDDSAKAVQDYNCLEGELRLANNIGGRYYGVERCVGEAWERWQVIPGDGYQCPAIDLREACMNISVE